MIRLTVLYNLPDDVDEDEFLNWRLTEHQKNNESMPGVVRTGFARILENWPEGSLPDYRFQTIVEWPDRAAFEAGFRDTAVQEKLATNLKRLGDYSFVVSEVLVESEASNHESRGFNSTHHHQ